MEKERNTPPKLLLKFFRWFCHPKLRDSIDDDLMELYEERVKEFGKRKVMLPLQGSIVLVQFNLLQSSHPFGITKPGSIIARRKIMI
ncbi:MAG TPA: hypothetical protein PKC10_12220 [Cyclobacteriaceae bacterium]|nr:hypothetical protein [Cyclobacteriaceae bacterium]